MSLLFMKVFNFPPCILHSLFFILLSPGGFLCFLPIICLAYTMLSLPLSLLGILRRAHMHRNTSHLSSRKLVFAHSFWNLPVRCLFYFCKLKPPLQNLVFLSFLCTGIRFLLVSDSRICSPSAISH